VVVLKTELAARRPSPTWAQVDRVFFSVIRQLGGSRLNAVLLYGGGLALLSHQAFQKVWRNLC
jgi:hypothetical protein